VERRIGNTQVFIAGKKLCTTAQIVAERRGGGGGEGEELIGGVNPPRGKRGVISLTVSPCAVMKEGSNLKTGKGKDSPATKYNKSWGVKSLEKEDSLGRGAGTGKNGPERKGALSGRFRIVFFENFRLETPALH